MYRIFVGMARRDDWGVSLTLPPPQIEGPTRGGRSQRGAYFGVKVMQMNMLKIGQGTNTQSKIGRCIARY
jgi:hypothetical protein